MVKPGVMKECTARLRVLLCLYLTLHRQTGPKDNIFTKRAVPPSILTFGETPYPTTICCSIND